MGTEKSVTESPLYSERKRKRERERERDDRRSAMNVNTTRASSTSTRQRAFGAGSSRGNAQYVQQQGRGHCVRSSTGTSTLLSRPRVGDLQVRNANPAIAPRTPELAGDPFALLLKQRIVFLGGEVNDFSADAVISQLLLLDSMDPSKDIKLFINSPGGSVTAGLGIYDAMNMCRADVSTVCFGLAASMGAFLLGAGAKGKRLSMPNARIMIHQPLGGAQGAAVDLEIQAKDYGIIDEIIGGEDAVSKVQGDTRYFPKTKEEYINWWRDAEGDSGERSSQFSNKPVEPFKETHTTKED